MEGIPELVLGWWTLDSDYGLYSLIMSDSQCSFTQEQLTFRADLFHIWVDNEINVVLAKVPGRGR